jgi:hypothetical protein
MITKILALAVLAALAASASDARFACNMKALTPQQRTRHAKLTHDLLAGVTERRELPDGYAFRTHAALNDVGEWITLERKCCPFFRFRLEVSGEEEWLWIQGTEGVKQFIAAEFRFSP